MSSRMTKAASSTAILAGARAGPRSAQDASN